MARVKMILAVVLVIVGATFLEIPEKLSDFVAAYGPHGSAREQETDDDEPPKRLWIDPLAIADVPGLADGNAKLGLDLYSRLRGQQANLVVAPIGVATTLGLLRAGARGETGLEIDRVLHSALDASRLHGAFAALIQRLYDDATLSTQPSPRGRGNDPAALHETRLSIANAIWASQALTVRADFEETAAEHYGAAIKRVDFGSERRHESNEIARWVRKATRGKIPHVIADVPATSEPSLVLMNAVYFRGSWATPFHREATTEQRFLIVGEQTVPVPMMHKLSGAARWANDGTVEILELPCSGGTFAMVFVLPAERHGLADLESTLTPERLNAWLSRLQPATVEIFLPKFRMALDADLTGTLAELGMDDAFLEGVDFSGIVDAPAQIRLAAIEHKVFIDVNEDGIEAAATTRVAVKSEEPPPPTAVFRADHPFLFVLRDVRNGTILFLGRVIDPSR
jgi:serpin B